jgi:hypothetical protein
VCGLRCVGCDAANSKGRKIRNPIHHRMSHKVTFASVAGLVTAPGAPKPPSKEDTSDRMLKMRVVRKDPDAVHRTGSLRDLFEICRLPGKRRELKEFLKVSPHLCRRTITYGKSHSYGIGWYPCHYPGYASGCSHSNLLFRFEVTASLTCAMSQQAILLRVCWLPRRDAFPRSHCGSKRRRPW